MSTPDVGVRDAEMIQFIADYRDANDYPPSLREMVDHFGLALSTIQWHLARMEREGKIARRPGGPRTIAVLPPGRALITRGKQISSPLEQL